MLYTAFKICTLVSVLTIGLVDYFEFPKMHLTVHLSVHLSTKLWALIAFKILSVGPCRAI